VADSGSLAQNSGVMLVSQFYFTTVAPTTASFYNTVDITTADQQHTVKAVQAINAQFLLANAQTAADALKSQQGLVDNIKKFLEIAGLLALLIGGVGIVNTMQVLLSRRKIEIAMLKTTGYCRTDLYLLFGLEAGLLGLAGGVIGALVATGVSYLVRGLVQQTFNINIPFVLDPLTISGGVLIGLVTALIFGLMPIVQAANIRPLNVIRELPAGNRTGSVALTTGLLLLLSVLFCILAVVILNDVILGIGAVYGAFVFLGLLSLFFTLVVFLVGKLPVPERFNLRFLGLLLLGVALSVLITLALPTFGYLLLALTLVGFLVVLLPRTWKSSTKMALRNIGRQRARRRPCWHCLWACLLSG
jgi:putative ABC transport system permease protein